jgi:propionyl-CoA synthetase
MTSSYAREYERSLSDPASFWGEAARDIEWTRPAHAVCDARNGGLARWFVGGQLNTCHNAVDRHVRAGRGDAAALIYDSAMTGTVRRYTFAELQGEVARVAGMLRALGVGVGDRVIIYMPMIPEAVFAMLACARLGAIHSVVFGGFAPPELAKRIDDARPLVVISASCGLEPGKTIAYKPLLDEALERARHRVRHCVIVQRPQLAAALRADRDRDWHLELERAQPADCVPVDATHPLYSLYTSGTTGVPKGIVRDNGGHAVALRWSLKNVFGMKPGEVFWAASDIGWVVGHSYIVYAPLLLGCATVLYEGKPVGTPDAGAFWRVVEQHGVHVLFTAPTAFRALRREDPDGELIRKHRIGGLRTLFLAGERADPATLRWAEEKLRIPAIDNWWQTELGWPALATCIGLGEHATRHGSAGRPVPGYQLAVLGERGEVLPADTAGDIAIRLPLPPGCLPGLWNDEAGMRAAYLDAHPGYYTTGDAGFRDADGYVHVMSRTDDIINVAGHRLSSGAIEQIVAAHPDVAECAVVAAADPIKGCVPVGLIVLKKGAARSREAVVAEVVASVRETIGAVASFKSVAVVAQLPKTRSGKVLRGAIRRIADGEACATPPTIDDPQSLDRVREALLGIGYAVEGGASAS